VAAVKMAVIRFSGAEDYWREAATMVRLPTTSSGVATAAVPDKFLPATLTETPCSVPSLLYFLRAELVIVRHKLKKL